MRNWYRRLAPILVLGLSFLTLAGCGSSAGTPATPPAPQGTSSSAPSPSKQVELNVLPMDGISVEALGDINREFETKFPGTRVRILDSRGRQFFGPGGANAQALDGVDVVLTNSALLNQLVNAKLVKDITAVKVPKLDDLVASLYDDFGQIEGKRYGITLSVTPQMLILNPDRLTQAGLKAPSLDWTWQDFEQLLLASKRAGVTNQIFAGAILEPLIRSYGGTLYDPDTKTWGLDQAETKQALAPLASMVSQELVLAQVTGPVRIMVGRGPGGGGGAPATGSGAGQQMEIPAITALGGGGGGAVFFGGGPTLNQFPYPKGPRGRSAPASATVAAVSANSANSETALEYARFLLTSQAQALLGKAGLRPVIADAKAMQAWQERVGSDRSAAIDSALQGAYVPQTPSTTGVISGLLPYLQGKAALEPTISNLMSTLK